MYKLINERTENITKVTSGTKKISFFGSIAYKVGKKSDIKEYFLREFQLMASAPDDSYLSSS